MPPVPIDSLSCDLRLRLAAEAANQLVLLRNRWGFELDPDFHAYLRANPVPMPLALVRRFRSQPSPRMGRR